MRWTLCNCVTAGVLLHTHRSSQMKCPLAIHNHGCFGFQEFDVQSSLPNAPILMQSPAPLRGVTVSNVLQSQALDMRWPQLRKHPHPS